MKECYQVDGHLSAPVYCVVHDRKGDYVITGADETLVKVWSAHSGRLMYTIRGHQGFITDIAVSPDNRTVATASADKTIRVSSLRNGETKNVLQGHGLQVNLICYDVLTSCLVTCSDDGSARVWAPSVSWFEEEVEEQEGAENVDQARKEVCVVQHASPRSDTDAPVDHVS